MNRDYTKLLKAGNAAQLEKLKENEHKSGFDCSRIGYLRTCVHDEMEELSYEIRKTPIDHQAIRREAADIANFAHMIILQCDKQLKTQE